MPVSTFVSTLTAGFSSVELAASLLSVLPVNLVTLLLLVSFTSAFSSVANEASNRLNAGLTFTSVFDGDLNRSTALSLNDFGCSPDGIEAGPESLVLMF